MTTLGELQKLERAHARRTLFDSFENLMVSPEGFALTTSSDLQKAIYQAVDGRGVLEYYWAQPHISAAFGGVRPPPVVPKEVLIASGIRAGKSKMAAAGAIYQSQKCSFAYADGIELGPGEMPRISIVSLRKDLADVVMQHLVGNVLERPALRKLLVGDPTADTVTLRHPSGRPVEIKVVAGARAGATLISRWSAGVIFDEAPRMLGDDEAVVNLEDMRSAVIGRLLDGSRIWYVGSPWQPFGPVYEMVAEHFGKKDAPVLVVKAPAYHLNPVYGTPKRCDELRLKDPDTARTDLDAEFADPETQLFKYEVLKRQTRSEPEYLAYKKGNDYIAAMDPATRSNTWSLTIFTREDDLVRQVGVWEYQGSKVKPLSPRATCNEIALVLRAYGLNWVKTDQWSVDSIIDFMQEFGISVVQDQRTASDIAKAYLNMARRLESGMLELGPNKHMREDLLRAKKKILGGSEGVKVVLPETQDGRHCDTAAAANLACSEFLDEPVAPPVEEAYPEPDDERAERNAFERELADDNDVEDRWVDLYD